MVRRCRVDAQQLAKSTSGKEASRPRAPIGYREVLPASNLEPSPSHQAPPGAAATSFTVYLRKMEEHMGHPISSHALGFISQFRFLPQAKLVVGVAQIYNCFQIVEGSFSAVPIFRKRERVMQHFSSSTRLAHFCTTQNSTFKQKSI